jgi:hypothetical protein
MWRLWGFSIKEMIDSRTTDTAAKVQTLIDEAVNLARAGNLKQPASAIKQAEKLITDDALN